MNAKSSHASLPTILAGESKRDKEEQRVGPTIDSDGNALRQSEAILADESGDLAKTAGREVLSGRLAELDLGDLEVEVVGLSNRLDGDAARVVLKGEGVSDGVLAL